MKRIIYFLLLSIFMFSCSKYEDGPVLSLRSKKERVAAEWEVTEYRFNGLDQFKPQDFEDEMNCYSGAKVSYSESAQLTRLIWTFEKNGDWNFTISSATKELDFQSTYNSCYPVYNYRNEQYTDKGIWLFNSNKEELEIRFDSGDPPINFKILELREKRMKLESRSSFGDVETFTFTKR